MCCVVHYEVVLWRASFSLVFIHDSFHSQENLECITCVSLSGLFGSYCYFISCFLCIINAIALDAFPRLAG